MTWWEALLLVAGGVFAGGVNAVAGGGSTLTVPLLVPAGVPGNSANGSNRVGVLTSNIAAAAAFRRLGVAVVVFFLFGIYGGAIQAGIGLVLVAALTRSGFDLVTANNIKVVVIMVVTAVALPVFILRGQVEWVPALVLAAGFTAGGWLGAHVAVKGGERLIRVVMLVAALVLAGGLLGLY